MEFISATALLIAITKKFIDLIFFLKSDQYKSAAVQAAVYLAGIGAVLLFAASPFAAAIALGPVSLAGANIATQILFGISVASAASVTHDVINKLGGGTSVNANPTDPSVQEQKVGF